VEFMSQKGEIKVHFEEYLTKKAFQFLFRKETTINFVKFGTFKRDALSLLPTDLLYFWTGFIG